MAPALVENSAAKERNSISKQYSKCCWSQFDLELHNFVKLLKTTTLPLIKRGPRFLEMNDSGNKGKQDISFADNEMVSFKDFPIIAFPNFNKGIYATTGYENGPLINCTFEKNPINTIVVEPPTCPQHVCPTTCLCPSKCPDVRPTENEEQYPLENSSENFHSSKEQAPLSDDGNVVDYLRKKKSSCGVKFSNLSKTMERLNQRVRQLQCKNVYSHVSSHVMKQTNGKSNKKTGNSRNKGVIGDKSWEDLHKVCDMISLKADDTDGDDLDLDHEYHDLGNKRRKKSENPAPSAAQVHQWKIQRASIGSRCTWLDMKISSLDEKITKLNELEKKQTNKNDQVDRILAGNSESGVKKLDSENDADNTCRRALPVTSTRKHTYVKANERAQSLVYGCRCRPTVKPCYECLRAQRQYAKETRRERTSRMDNGFHSRLSFQNDVSLSFLMEEALRKQKIKTKVTISKPTKKKKKQKLKEGSGNNELSEKQAATNKSFKRSYLRSRGERLDRYKNNHSSQKQTSTLESAGHGGRSRKSRKLSESEESWKPSTPTELNSPFSRDMSSAFFPLKRKKNSSGAAAYDINNIVIPYSMAASTRVERIQYKEIPTPGWRNIDSNLNEQQDDEYETTDDESYAERHNRCELNEKNKFADCYVPTVVRRRANQLSESTTVSGPPSPLVCDEPRPNNNNHHNNNHNSAVTPSVDSPLTVAASLLSNRLTNLIVVPDDERHPGWTLRKYPLNSADCANLKIVTVSSINTPNHEWTSTDNSSNNNAPITTTCRLLATETTNTHSSQHTHNLQTTTNTTATTNDDHNVDSEVQSLTAMSESQLTSTLKHIPMQCSPLPTSLYTPMDTPMPSPSCSVDNNVDQSDCEEETRTRPNKWTVTENSLGSLVGQVEQQRQQQVAGDVSLA